MLDATPARLRLRRPEPARPPVRLDEVQAAVVATPADAGHLLVVGAPGTGKTTTAVEALVARLTRPGAGPGVLLVPTRRAAARVRDVVAARLARTSVEVVVRTPASFAYEVLRTRAALLREPPPTLITGPEQDAVLAELLAGHREGLGARVGWPAAIGADTLAQPAFRAELRDLLMRAAELGLEPAALAARGRAHGREDWVAAARVLAEYEDVTALGATTPDRGARYDVARIVDEAVSALRHWEHDLPDHPRPRWRTVVVDDHQDSTLATARLLHVLADDGAQLLLLGDPDAGVQSFRGGAPALVGAAQTDAEVGGFGARRVDLPRVWRGDERLREVARRVSARISTRAVAAHRSATAAPAPEEADGVPPGGVEVAVLPSGAQEVAFVARRLREERLHSGTAWDRMAVVARSAAQVSVLRRGLAAAGVPVSSDAGPGPLRAEPAVRPLLGALRAVLDGLDGDAAVDLLCSPLGGMDAVSVRALRRSLRAAGLGADALPEVLAEPGLASGLPGPHRTGPARVARVLAAGRVAAAQPHPGARDVLWALWHATGLAGPWRSRALAGGPGADRADADLDALMALFRAAEQFDERHRGAGPRAFLDHVLRQDLPADTLAARAVRTAAVQVLTPAAAGGEEWDVVVVAGLQEDVWPDLRLRDSLLGSRLLADLEADRTPAPDGRDRAVARREVLDDELRMFLVALTRARRRLVVTAVLDLDSRPSSFLELVAGPGDAGALVREVPPALDLRGLVAELRAELDRPAGPDGAERREAAARLLATLARSGVAGADPAEWAGLDEPTTLAPLRPDGEPVPVSPSSVGMAESCPLRWALESAGGRGEDSLVQSLGTLVHEIAAELPGGTAEEMRAALAERWHTLGVPDGWAGRRTRAEAEAMVDRLAAYVAAHPGEVAVEVPFTADVGRAHLTGRIDRVERVPGDPGAVRVVDLKTGKSPVSAADGEQHPQLATYQVAVEAGALGEDARSAGARLVYLGAGASGPTTREQRSLADAEEPGWAHELVDRAAQAMAGATFPARVGAACATCPVRTSCPAVEEGRRTTA